MWTPPLAQCSSFSLGLAALVFLAACAQAQLKDCFAVHEEAKQSRESALRACCTGTFDRSKKNSQGWIWHEGLNLYVDESKCDRGELRELLIQDLKGKKGASSENETAPAAAERAGTSPNRQSVPERKFSNGNFRGANLAGVVHTYKMAENADFEGANLENANFEGTTLTGANFRNAWLRDAKFDYAYLKNAVFANAVLTGVSFKGAVLRGANFIGARVTAAQLSAAHWVGVIVDATLQKSLHDLDKGMEKVVGDK